MRHGLLAKCIVLEIESHENFESLLQQHVDRFQPADGVEFGMIEDMCAAYWRLHRAWAIETRMLDKQVAIQPATQTSNGELDRLATAFEYTAASPAAAVMHRYQARLHLMYQRAIRNFILLRTVDLPNDDVPNNDVPNEPSPITGHSPAPAPDQPEPPQHADSEPLGSASFSLRSWQDAQVCDRPPGLSIRVVAA